MKFRYNDYEMGSYFVIMKFGDIKEANRWIKQEEEKEDSEFIDYKILD